MTNSYDLSYRGWAASSHAAASLEDKFEVIKDIGDGSFGSVVLGRTRSAGAQFVRRGTLVAIKTMKKTFDSFAQCMELREVIFLKSLPNHPHLVPAYDIFLDPFSKKLHIAMEYMDGNLYQLMKARDHKPLDCSTVKSILFQILAGLEHIHAHHFFHRDIKPENILVSTSAPDTGSTFKRYSQLVTPPSTPPAYSIKIADFGLARETHSRVPYTTYVSTRWYRAPEVLLRAGEYSAPVDIWAVGAMAVEIATLKPLFPGGNEVDQVWRVCEIMGSPGSWVNRHGQRIGGGEWKEGIRLAHKLGFSFPKMAPHSLETVLPTSQWPSSLTNFVTWCLMWDPKLRPTSRQALEHEYFHDAFDPLRPKSAVYRGPARKSSTLGSVDHAEGANTLSTKTSLWFRKSLGTRDSYASSAVPEHSQQPQDVTSEVPPPPPPPPADSAASLATASSKRRPVATKRATWTMGLSPNVAPMPILPTIRPISPLPDSSTAQASVRHSELPQERPSKKIGRQLSVNSQGNHYADLHRQEAERALTGTNALKSPTGSQRESFFSHLRKRARRLSGRHQGTPSALDDLEANAGCAPWAGNRQSVPGPPPVAPAPSDPSNDPNFADLDRALQNVRYSLDSTANTPPVQVRQPVKMASNPILKRHHSLPYAQENIGSTTATSISTRTRMSLRHATSRYETPCEEDELLDEALASAHRAAKRLDSPRHDHDNGRSQPARPSVIHGAPEPVYTGAYLTPSHSKDQMGVSFGSHSYTTSDPVDIPAVHAMSKQVVDSQWPTPPDDDHDWAAAAAASILATQAAYL